MELSRVIWAWEPLLQYLAEEAPVLGVLVGASCRPIAADRLLGGELSLILGNWINEFRKELRAPEQFEPLQNAISGFLHEPVKLQIVRWPAGDVPLDHPEVAAAVAAYRSARSGNHVGSPVVEAPRPIQADRLPPDLRVELGKCESVLQRMLFAELLARKLKPVVQHRVGSFRVDFALLSARIGVDIVGWEPVTSHRSGLMTLEREQEIMSHRWMVRSFSGRQVYEQAKSCADQIARLAHSRSRETRY